MVVIITNDSGDCSKTSSRASSNDAEIITNISGSYCY